MIRLVLHQTRYDLLAFVRNRQTRFFTLLLPLMFLVIFVSVFGGQSIGPRHIRASDYYVPGIAALAVLTPSFSQLVIVVTAQRESGVLKRRRATPAPAAVIIAGRALTSLAVSLAVTAVVIAVGSIAFGVHVAADGLGAVALSIAVGSLVLACLGYAVSSAIASADAAQPIVLALTLPLSFISGVYVPAVNLPGALHLIADAFPLEHLVAALGRGFLPGAHGVAWGDLAMLAAWGVAGALIALARFRWEPSATHA